MFSADPNSKGGGLAALSYGSMAGPSLQDPLDLADILGRLRVMNTELNVTGAIASEGGFIQQWIEGPAGTLGQLWDRIRLDPRHRVQWATPPAVVASRHFPGSPLKLALTTAALARLDSCLIEDVVTLPDSLSPAGASIWADAHDNRLLDPLRSPAAGGIGAFYHLDPAHRAGRCKLAQARAAALADVLTGTDPQVARRHLDIVLKQIGVLETATLVQAVLEHLQSGWMAGLLSALQRQLAVTMLQSALRLRLDVAEHPQTLGSALVSVLPGTPDLCGVMLKVALLRRAGWSVRLLLPQSIKEIQTVVHGLQPDLIVLSGSWLTVGTTEQTMMNSLLPVLSALCGAPVIVGGKMAETAPQALLNRGAAAVCGAMSWIATIAAHVAPGTEPAAKGNMPTIADDMLGTYLAANRARAGRN